MYVVIKVQILAYMCRDINEYLYVYIYLYVFSYLYIFLFYKSLLLLHISIFPSHQSRLFQGSAEAAKVGALAVAVVQLLWGMLRLEVPGGDA